MMGCIQVCLNPLLRDKSTAGEKTKRGPQHVETGFIFLECHWNRPYDKNNLSFHEIKTLAYSNSPLIPKS